jgi:CHAT domain-containing protein
LPFGDKLDLVRLLIVERGQPAFSSIPFEAMVREDGAYLAERYAVAYTEGIEYLDPASTLPKNFFLQPALVVAGPSAPAGRTSSLMPLPEAVEEVREISGLFQSAAVLEGHRATPEVLRRELMKAIVFHFAGHASATPGRTGLLLATVDGTESFVFGPENSSDNLANLQFVFLSACSTARSAGEDALDLAGLAQSYRLAGSKVVLGNKWTVDSATSKYFASAFYLELAAGSPIPEAVERAEARLRSSAGFEHPYFWSAPTLLL